MKNKIKEMSIKYKKCLGILVFISIMICLTGCSVLSKDEQKEAKQLVKEYSSEFKDQVKKLYGENSTLQDIDVLLNETGALSYELTNNLKGKVKTGNETFNVMYSIEENKVFPHFTKNLDVINNSVPNYFSDVLGIDICYSLTTITISKVEDNYLPEEVDTFEELKDIRGVSVKLFTTSDISQMSSSSFLNIKDETNSSHIRIYQIEDASKAKQIAESKEVTTAFYLNVLSDEERKALRAIGVIRALDNDSLIKNNGSLDIKDF